ncbi:heme peroxidase [Halteromyces radiatus]|uniref:heme peroxidase n=1 Tax=Halteromyces radiatus TaxID=101107 RepID=UPI0022209FE9|nr:heme peroxidase [Halteromyces radiatus]KAI8089623.1 heme peroxidase [Halteromyces radiatus]
MYLGIPNMTVKDNHNNDLGKIHSYISVIDVESGRNGLVNALKELVIHISQGKNDKDGKKRMSLMKSFASPYSSQPTGKAWRIQALVKDLENLFGITPQRTNAIKEILSLPLSQQKKMIGALIERLLVSGGAPMNDRSGTLESTLSILSDTIKKPYINYMGHSFRRADGSFNCINLPNVGKAGNYYVRNVTSTALVNENLPSPHVVFERLLKRPEGQFNPHKSGINMFLFYFAILITHDLFYTDRRDPRRNLTSSYIDMSYLYGFNRTDQESVRQMKNGLLKNDQWFDKRLVIQPPGVGAFAVLFSRNHNYIAKKLLEINENDRFSYGPGKRLATEVQLDEELFQTARLINNACFINIIVQDYLRSISGAQQDANFVFNPLARPSYPTFGNEVSVEFNIVYRWHAAIGQHDEKWLNSVMSVLGSELRYQAQVPPMLDHLQEGNDSKGPDETRTQPGTDQSELDALLPSFNSNFAKATPEELEKGLPLDGAHRDIETGSFRDADLAQLLRRGYNQIASEIGNGLGVPASMEPIEIAGIIQARALGCCYFNEFRKYLDLLPLKTFEDFSDKVEVQTALKELYGTPDKVELYAGLMVERTLLIGLRLPYTMTRGVLSDAINLLRNDRILTQELVPSTLTNWGYEFSQGEPEHFGRIFPKMLRLHLANAHPDGAPVFTDKELKNLFVVPDFHDNSH